MENNNNNNTMFSSLWTTEVEASNTATQLFRYIQIFRYPELIVHVVNG